MTDKSWPAPPVVDLASSTDGQRVVEGAENVHRPPGDLIAGDDDEALIGVSFDGVLKAQEFLLALKRLSMANKMALRDAVLVMKDDDGHVSVRETVDPQPGRAALSASVWTGLLGLLVGGPVGWLVGIGVGASAGVLGAKLVDFGVPDEWVAWFKTAVRPHTATVVVLAARINFEALNAEARRFAGAELIHTTLKPEFARALEEGFDATSR